MNHLYLQNNEPLLDEVTGRRLRGTNATKPYNKKQIDRYELDDFFNEMSYMNHE